MTPNYPGMTPGFPGMGQQPMGQMGMPPAPMAPSMMMPPMTSGGPMPPGPMMGGPMMGGPMMGGPMMGGPMMGAPMGMARPEESYVENILRMNRGKVATVYTTNENNPQWPAKVFKGRVENAARDHVVLSDPETGMRYIILMVNIDYLTFDEPLRYGPGIYREM